MNTTFFVKGSRLLVPDFSPLVVVERVLSEIKRIGISSFQAMGLSWQLIIDGLVKTPSLMKRWLSKNFDIQNVVFGQGFSHIYGMLKVWPTLQYSRSDFLRHHN